MEWQFGFRSADELANATMGIPINMYYWENNNIVKSQTYRVPVLVNGRMVSLLTVLADEKMSAGDFGANRLAHIIQNLVDTHKVYPVGILRIYSITSDFFMFLTGGEIQYIPISANIYDHSRKVEILNLEDIRQTVEKRAIYIN